MAAYKSTEAEQLIPQPMPRVFFGICQHYRINYAQAECLHKAMSQTIYLYWITSGTSGRNKYRARVRGQWYQLACGRIVNLSRTDPQCVEHILDPHSPGSAGTIFHTIADRIA